MNLCERLREGLDAGDPSVLADPALQAHLETCAACRDAVDADSALRQALAGLGRPPMSPELRSRLMALAEDGGAGETAARAKTASWMSGPIDAESLAGRFRSAPTTRERLVAAALLVACLAGLAFVLKREQTAPANLDGTAQPLPTAATREAMAPTPPESQATAWPTPLPPLPPLPMVADEGLTLPEGALVVVRDDTGLWLHRGTEKGRRLVEDGQVGGFKISPDGRWVAYESWPRGWDRRGSALWVVSLDRGTARMAVDTAEVVRQVSTAEPWNGHRIDMVYRTVMVDRDAWTWTPDSSAIVFSTVVEEPDTSPAPLWQDVYLEHFVYTELADLWTQRISGGPPKRLLEPGKGGHPAYAPDGAHIALSQSMKRGERWESRIALIRSDGSDWRLLMKLPHMSSESDWTTYPLPQWTADSRQLLVAAGIPESRHDASTDLAYFDGPVRLVRLGLDGSMVEVAEGAGGSLPMWRQNYNGFWSPGGEKVAYFATLPPANGRAPASDPLTTPTEDGTFPAYPEPGEEEGHRTVALIIAAVDGGPGQVYDWLSKPTQANCFSPSGERFAYGNESSEPFPWDHDSVGRTVTLGQVPRVLAQGFRACRWLSEEQLLLEDGKGLRLHALDGRERQIWSAETGSRVDFDIHLASLEPASPVAPAAAVGGASAAHSPSDKLSGTGVAITLPFDPREWEWEVAAVAGEDPWLRSRSVRSCRLRLTDPGIEFGPASARLEIGGALVYVEQSNGFQGHYFVAAAAANRADAEFDFLLDVRFAPGSWSACDRAVRGLIAGLP